MGRLARAFIEILRLTFRRERLGDVPPRPRGTRRRRSFLRMLLAPESLAFDSPVVKRPHLGIARSLFSPEDLPFDPPAHGRQRTRWPRWLFGRERLDQP